MIKRKLSLNFRDVFRSPRSEQRKLQKFPPPPNSDNEHSPPSSPHAGRRPPLSKSAELELKMACIALVNNTMPPNMHDDIMSGSNRKAASTAGIISTTTKRERRTSMMPARTVSQPAVGVGGASSTISTLHENHASQLFTEADRKHYTSQSSLGRAQLDPNFSFTKNESIPEGSITIVSNLPAAKTVLRRAASQYLDSVSSIPESPSGRGGLYGDSQSHTDSPYTERSDVGDTPNSGVISKRRSWYGKLFGLNKPKSMTNLALNDGKTHESHQATSCARENMNATEEVNGSQDQQVQDPPRANSQSQITAQRLSSEVRRRSSVDVRRSNDLRTATSDQQQSKSKNHVQSPVKSMAQAQARAQAEARALSDTAPRISTEETLRILTEAAESSPHTATPPRRQSSQSSQLTQSSQPTQSAQTNQNTQMTDQQRRASASIKSKRASKRASVEYMRRKSIAELDRRNSLIHAHQPASDPDAEFYADGGKKLGETLLGFIKHKAPDEVDTAKAQLEGTDKPKDKGRRGSVSVRPPGADEVDHAGSLQAQSSKAQDDRMRQTRARRLSSSVRAAQTLSRRDSEQEDGVDVNVQSRSARRGSSYEPLSKRQSLNLQDLVRSAGQDEGDRRALGQTEDSDRDESKPSFDLSNFSRVSSNQESETEKPETIPRRRSSQKDYLNLKLGGLGDLQLGSIVEVDARGQDNLPSTEFSNLIANDKGLQQSRDPDARTFGPLPNTQRGRSQSTTLRTSETYAGGAHESQRATSLRKWRSSWGSWRDSDRTQKDSNTVTSLANPMRTQSMGDGSRDDEQADLAPSVVDYIASLNSPHNHNEVQQHDAIDDARDERNNYVSTLWHKAAVKRRSQDLGQKLANRRSMELRISISTDITKSTEIATTPCTETPLTSEPGTPAWEVDQSFMHSPIFPLPFAMAQLKSPGISRRFTLIAKTAIANAAGMQHDKSQTASKRMSAPLPLHPPPALPLPRPPPPIEDVGIDGPVMALAKEGRRYSWTVPESTEPSAPEQKHVPLKRLSTKLEVDDGGEVDADVSEYLERMHSTVFDPKRSDSTHLYNALRSTKYQYADDIESLGLTPSSAKEKRHLLKKKSSKERRKTWMDEMENLGVKDGVLMMDQLAGPPIVRY